MNAIQQPNEFMPQDLALTGNCGYEIQNDRVVITISEISNRRPQGDVSGTLAIELWAFKQPQAADTGDASLLASTQIGEIFGEHLLADCRYDLLFQEPPAGKWFFALLLREWTADGYVTRDRVNFSLPYVAAAKASVVRSETDNVIKLNFSATKETPAKENEASAEPLAKADEAQDPSLVSMNEASVKDIKEIKGVSKKLAENIVATRPFSTIDDLLKVKGMGAKLLEKIRAYITL